MAAIEKKSSLTCLSYVTAGTFFAHDAVLTFKEMHLFSKSNNKLSQPANREHCYITSKYVCAHPLKAVCARTRSQLGGNTGCSHVIWVQCCQIERFFVKTKSAFKQIENQDQQKWMRRYKCTNY